MHAEEVIRQAEQRSFSVDLGPLRVEALTEQLRIDCLRFFHEVPEPPLYRRADDPLVAAAAGFVPRAAELLSRCFAIERRVGEPGALRVFEQALRAHVEALCATEAGKLAVAEERWRTARALEREAEGLARGYAASEEAEPPVFHRGSGKSRFDPQPEPTFRVSLCCVQPACRHSAEFTIAPRHPTFRFECVSCHAPFLGYFAHVGSLTTDARGTVRTYRLALTELGGSHSRIEFEDASGAELSSARGDLMAFLYNDAQELRVVTNLSTRQLLWLQRPGCFVATVAFGGEAEELRVFRNFRDRALIQSSAGRCAVRLYYRFGPAAARVVARHPRLRAAVRSGLSRAHRALSARGFA